MPQDQDVAALSAIWNCAEECRALQTTDAAKTEHLLQARSQHFQIWL